MTPSEGYFSHATPSGVLLPGSPYFWFEAALFTEPPLGLRCFCRSCSDMHVIELASGMRHATCFCYQPTFIKQKALAGNTRSGINGLAYGYNLLQSRHMTRSLVDANARLRALLEARQQSVRQMAEYNWLRSLRVAAYASAINRLKTVVAKLQRMQFGKNSEKLRQNTERQVCEGQERIRSLQEVLGCA